MTSISNNKNTSKQKTKDIVLRAFKIKNSTLSKKSSGFKSKLLEQLENTTNVRERFMPLNNSDSEKDLISNYSNLEKYKHLYCTMLRIIQDKDIDKIDDSFFNKRTFAIADLESTSNQSGYICKDSFYFTINDNFLVTNLHSRTTISRIQTYLRYFLEDISIEFTPMIEFNKSRQIKELSYIKFQDTPVIQNKAEISYETDVKSEDTKTKRIDIKGAAIDLIKSILSDTKSLNNIKLEEVISAELFLRFKKPKKMTREEYENILGASLKPVSDVDNIIFKPKKGGADIKGKDLLKTKLVSISTTSNGRLNENEVFQAMSNFIIELEDDKTSN